MGQDIIRFVEEYKFIGVYHTSSLRYIYAKNYEVKASKARNVSNATFAMESCIDGLPPWDGRRIYKARVEPHLSFAAEIALDVDLNLLGLYEEVENQFLRRLLGLNRRSVLAPIFTDVDIMPIRFRRALIAVRYLQYLGSLPDHHYAFSALKDSVDLAISAKPSWICDLMHVLSRSRCAIDITQVDLKDPMVFDSLQESVTKACENSLLADLNGYTKLEIMGNWRKWSSLVVSDTSDSLLTFQNFLHIPIKNHRLALTRLLFSDHNLSVERLRYAERYRPYIPREFRLCRFCYAAIEDECHALFMCIGDISLQRLRDAFLQDIFHIHPLLSNLHQNAAPMDFLTTILKVDDNVLLRRLGKYVYETLMIYEDKERWIPAQYLYAGMQVIEAFINWHTLIITTVSQIL
jgi:hypothetical protein